MTLTFHPDTRVADWIAESGTPDMQLLLFGPAVFGAYARQRFIPDPTAPGQVEGSVPLPDDHRPDIEQARSALDVLARFTTTPDDCYFAIWEGYSDLPLPPGTTESTLFTLPHRRFALVHGSLDDRVGWTSTFVAAWPPAFVWPVDRSWCFASDVDPHWAGIGADQVAIDALVATPGVDVVPAHPTDAQPWYR